MTAADWAPYGIGEPDADGWYLDYRTPPAALRPAPPKAAAAAGPDIDRSLLGLVMNWRVVTVEVAEVYGIDLYDPAVLARPWPGIRDMIFALIDRPGGWLRAALTRR